MEDVGQQLRTGITAARFGNKDEARAWFVQVVKRDPRNEIAWLWLSSVMPTTEHAIKCLDHLLGLNPRHAQAREAREILGVRLLLEEASLAEQRAGQSEGTSRRASVRLGDLLLQQKVLTPEQLETALAEQRRLARLGRPTRLGEVLLSTKLIRREQLAAALRAQIDALKSHEEPGTVPALGQYLVRNNYISAEDLARALSLQSLGARQGHAPKLGDVLVREGYITRPQLEQALLEQSREYYAHFR